MNQGTPRNILTQLNITSDEFGLITVLYTVSSSTLTYGVDSNSHRPSDPVHPCGSSVQPHHKEGQAICLAVQNYVKLVSDDQSY